MKLRTRMVTIKVAGVPRIFLFNFPPIFVRENLVTSKDAEALIIELTKQKRELAAVEEALKNLPMSWAKYDPGKNGAAYFFLNKEGNRAVVLELLPPGFPVYQDPKDPDYLEYKRTHNYYDGAKAVTPDQVLIPFANVLMAPCPVCGTPQPVFERYQQTEDSPLGDSWGKWRQLICCGKVQTLDSIEKDQRFC